MYPFKRDFYGHEMKSIVLGYIRPELDYVSRGRSQFSLFFPRHLCMSTSEALIEDIEMDKRVALKSLLRPAYEKYKLDPHFHSTYPRL